MPRTMLSTRIEVRETGPFFSHLSPTPHSLQDRLTPFLHKFTPCLAFFTLPLA